MSVNWIWGEAEGSPYTIPLPSLYRQKPRQASFTLYFRAEMNRGGTPTQLQGKRRGVASTVRGSDSHRGLVPSSKLLPKSWFYPMSYLLPNARWCGLISRKHGMKNDSLLFW